MRDFRELACLEHKGVLLGRPTQGLLAFIILGHRWKKSRLSVTVPLEKSRNSVLRIGMTGWPGNQGQLVADTHLPGPDSSLCPSFKVVSRHEAQKGLDTYSRLHLK